MEKEKSFTLEIITMEKSLLREKVSFAVVPSKAGPVGILPNHAPLLGIVRAGMVSIRLQTEKIYQIFVGNGFFMISREGVIVVVKRAELSEKIDLEKTLAEKERTLERIAATSSASEVKVLKEELEMTEAKIKAATKMAESAA